MSLFEKRFGHPYSMEDLHEFGQWVVVRHDNPKKLTARGKYGCWIGYDDESKGYFIYDKVKVCTEQQIQFLKEDPYKTEGEKIPSVADEPINTNDEEAYTEAQEQQDLLE